MNRAGWIIGAGICAALHVAKLAPAIPALQASLGLSLVQAGFLLSVVQLAGMTAGVAFGAFTDGLGHRRCLLGGLALLAAASALGGMASGAAMLLALRAVEGCGFLLVVLSAPALLRHVVEAEKLPRALGVWGAYMPVATGAAFFAGPLLVASFGWRAWWWALAVVTLATSLAVARAVPAPLAMGAVPAPLPVRAVAAPSAAGAAARAGRRSALADWWQRLLATLARPGPWCVALAFGCYSAQWLAVVGFLPTLYAAAGWPAWLVATLGAAVAGSNAIGNIGAGRLLARGWAPLTLLAIAFGTMGVGALLTYWELLAAPPRVAAALIFSMVGGMIPATLFTCAVRVAPSPQAVGTTLGWVQQLSATGQFAGPPLVAWVATLAGGWHFTGVVAAALAAAGLVFAALLSTRLPEQPLVQAGVPTLPAVSPSSAPR